MTLCYTAQMEQDEPLSNTIHSDLWKIQIITMQNKSKFPRGFTFAFLLFSLLPQNSPTVFHLIQLTLATMSSCIDEGCSFLPLLFHGTGALLPKVSGFTSSHYESSTQMATCLQRPSLTTLSIFLYSVTLFVYFQHYPPLKLSYLLIGTTP